MGKIRTFQMSDFYFSCSAREREVATMLGKVEPRRNGEREKQEKKTVNVSEECEVPMGHPKGFSLTVAV